jgi:hypothetical protein
VSIKIRTVLGWVKCNTAEGFFGISLCTKTVDGHGQASVENEGGVFAAFAEINVFL